MTSPLVIPLILEADGGIESLALRIVLIDKQSETQTHMVGSLLGSHHQFLGYSQATIFREYGQGIKI
jgi:hypothetical protein